MLDSQKAKSFSVLFFFFYFAFLQSCNIQHVWTTIAKYGKT